MRADGRPARPGLGARRRNSPETQKETPGPVEPPPGATAGPPGTATRQDLPQPASAVSNPHLCETNGSYCLGSQPDIGVARLVTEQSPGRNLVLTPLGGRYDNYPTYLIQFSADPTKCVGTDNTNVIMIRPCSNG